jgi:hypothetical protein
MAKNKRIEEQDTEQIAEEFGDFEAAVSSGHGGGAGSRLNLTALKQLIDDFYSVYDRFVKTNGKPPAMSLEKINARLGMTRQSAAGVGETLNIIGYQYLKQKGLWFSASRTAKQVKVKKVDESVFNKMQHYASESRLDENGEAIVKAAKKD